MTVCIPTQEGVPYVKWIDAIQLIFGDCVYGMQDAISLLLGYASIVCWLNAQLPQVIKNYKLGSAEGLSLNFLAIWLAGDTANLIGTILTHQLPFQLYLGVYFVSIDICLLSQWIYYNRIKTQPQHYNENYVIINPKLQQEQNKQSIEARKQLFHHPAEIPIQKSSKQMIIDELTPFSSSASPSKWYTLNDNSKKEPDNKIKTFMSILFFFTLNMSPTHATETALISQDKIIWLGRLFAWTCTCLYLMSRIPQLFKNYRRQSVEGLSASLFVFAVCGNLTYSSSILTHPGQTVDTLLEALPYLIGSAGTLVFDFSIFCQFIYYRSHNKVSNHDIV